MAKRGPKANLELNDRELKVLHLLSEGLETREIAHSVGVSKSTIDGVKSRILRKYNARNIQHAIALYWRFHAPRETQATDTLPKENEAVATK